MYLELDYGTFEIFYADEETVAQWNQKHIADDDMGYTDSRLCPRLVLVVLSSWMYARWRALEVS